MVCARADRAPASREQDRPASDGSLRVRLSLGSRSAPPSPRPMPSPTASSSSPPSVVPDAPPPARGLPPTLPKAELTKLVLKPDSLKVTLFRKKPSPAEQAPTEGFNDRV